MMRIAISKTLNELSGRVGFLAFAEVFGRQDEERCFEIMEAFHTIKEQYRQILLISMRVILRRCLIGWWSCENKRKR